MEKLVGACKECPAGKFSRMLVKKFLPVLAMGWGTQVLTLLVSEWWAHRKIALAREKQEGQEATKSEMVRI